MIKRILAAAAAFCLLALVGCGDSDSSDKSSKSADSVSSVSAPDSSKTESAEATTTTTVTEDSAPTDDTTTTQEIMVDESPIQTTDSSQDSDKPAKKVNIGEKELKDLLEKIYNKSSREVEKVFSDTYDIETQSWSDYYTKVDDFELLGMKVNSIVLRQMKMSEEMKMMDDRIDLSSVNLGDSPIIGITFNGDCDEGSYKDFIDNLSKLYGTPQKGKYYAFEFIGTSIGNIYTDIYDLTNYGGSIVFVVVIESDN